MREGGLTLLSFSIVDSYDMKGYRVSHPSLSQKVQKIHFLAVFELLLDSLTAICVELPQCPSHHSILQTRGTI